MLYRGAVDSRQERVHLFWKPILNCFKNMCQPSYMSRTALNVTNLQPKHEKCRDFVFFGLGSALYQAVSSIFIHPCVQKYVWKINRRL